MTDSKRNIIWPEMNNELTDDLKAFEKRMGEIMDYLQPIAWWWRCVFGILICLVIFSAYRWLVDPRTYESTGSIWIYARVEPWW